MATLQFPDSPGPNAVYDAPNGVQYVWTGEYWAANDAEDRFDARYVKVTGDNMTGDLTLGTDKIDLNASSGSVTATGPISSSDSVAVSAPNINGSAIIVSLADGTPKVKVYPKFLYGGVDLNDTHKVEIRFDTGNITTDGNVTATSYNTGPLAGFRNQLMNGDFQIVQRYSGSQMTGTGYLTDRWYCGANVSSDTVCDLSQSALASSYFPRVARIGNVGAPSNTIRQSIELPMPGHFGQFAVGTQWTFSCYVQDGTPAPTFPAFGFADTAGGSNAVQQTGVPEPTVTTENAIPGYTRYKTTFTISVTPNAANVCAYVRWVGEGTVLTGNQLEPGPIATPYEVIPIQTQLANCQRYFYQYDVLQETGTANSGLFMTTFMGGSNTRSGIQLTHPVTMRITPVVTNLSVRDMADASSGTCTSKYLVIVSPVDQGSSNRYPAVQSFRCDAEF